MKKRYLALLLAVLSALLCGCGSNPPKEQAVTPTPAPAAAVMAPVITAQGKLADTARERLAPYQAQISAVAEHNPSVLTYTIPGDMINKLAQDASLAGAQPENGRYAFTWSRAEEHTYSASAMQIKEIEAAAEATPDPGFTGDPVMDNQQMGDFSVTGGGVFEQVCTYDASETLSEGTAEIVSTLNGGVSAHEFFSFAVEDGHLYFVDAALDQAVGLDGLVATERYLVAAGVLRTDSLEIIEFTVPGRDQVPAASAARWKELLSSASSLSHLTARGDEIKVSP